MINNYTEKGLKIIIIGLVLLLVDSVLSFFANNLEGAISSILEIISGNLTFIGFILLLVGLIFMFLGRKEFSKKHKNFVILSIILFIVSIIVTFILLVYFFFSLYSLASSTMFNDNVDVDVIVNIMYNFIFISLIIGIMEAFYQLFIVHALEEKKGKTILYAAFVVTIITIISIGLIAVPLVNEISEEINESNNKAVDRSSRQIMWGEEYTSSREDNSNSDSSVEQRLEKFTTQLNMISSIKEYG